MDGKNTAHLDVCHGCGSYILEKTKMKVNDCLWHENCLKCQDCGMTLAGRCYYKNEAFYCPMHYTERFSPKCSGCKRRLLPLQHVSHVLGLTFHVSCLCCVKCGKTISTGDQAYKAPGNNIACEKHRHHTTDDQDFIIHNDKAMKAKLDLPTSQCQAQANTATESNTQKELSISLDETLSTISEASPGEKTVFSADELTEVRTENSWDDFQNDSSKNNMADTISSTVAVTSIYDEGGGSDEKVGSAEAGIEEPCRLDQDEVVNSHASNSKKRGPRTTIKPKQLERLKLAFAKAEKPTRHDREQLAKETGLPMRVIQVWFQNRRSKERRLNQVNKYGTNRRQMYSRFPPRRLQNGFFLQADECQAPYTNILEPAPLRSIAGIYNYNDRAYTEKFHDGGRERTQLTYSRCEGRDEISDPFFAVTAANLKQENGVAAPDYFREGPYLQEIPFHDGRVAFLDGSMATPESCLQQSAENMMLGRTSYAERY